MRVALAQDDEGWPPVPAEGLWVREVANGTLRLENAPWFARDLAFGDVVGGELDADGVLWFVERLEWSGWCTVRVVPRPDGALRGDLASVLEAFAPWGVSGEGLPAYGIVVLNVSPDADLAPVKRELEDGEADGRWYYEEGCVSTAWLDT